jgi:dihydroorotate dehydrogenase electron transfer subunit
MSGSERAAHYADFATHHTVPLLENVPLARDTYRVRIECPQIARRILPGQFLMMRLPDCNDPLLGRPLALYDTVLDADDAPVGLDIVYLVLGKFTRRLAQTAAGEKITLWGPLGNGFPPRPTEHLIMVAGGIGQTPFVALAQEYLAHRRYGEPPREIAAAQQVTLCYGARTAEYLAGIEDFQRIGVQVRLSTDDGSRGHHGFVTDLLQQALDETTLSPRIACCGPEPMMEAVTKIAIDRDVPCEVSLETPMACGIGICFTCVAKVRDETGGWDYKRTCVEGPVFDARKIVWG